MKRDIFRKEKFSIRKFNVGAFSVMIGATLFLTGANTANADEIKTNDETVTSNAATADPSENQVQLRAKREAATKVNVTALNNYISQVQNLIQNDTKYLFADVAAKTLVSNDFEQAQKLLFDIELGKNEAEYTQAYVDKFVSEAQAHVNALSGEKPSRQAITDEIALADKTKQTDYYTKATEKTRKALDDAIAHAQQVEDNILSTAFEINQAAKAIETARLNLDGVNRAELEDEIEDEDAMTASPRFILSNEEAKQAYLKAIEEAKKLTSMTEFPLASKEAVDNALAAINNAKQNLQGTVPDLSYLQAIFNGKLNRAIVSSANYSAGRFNGKQAEYNNTVYGTEHKLQEMPAYQDIVNGKVPSSWTEEMQKDIDNRYGLLMESLTKLFNGINFAGIIKASYQQNAVRQTPEYFFATDDSKKVYDDTVNETLDVLYKIISPDAVYLNEQQVAEAQETINKALAKLEAAKNQLNGKEPDKTNLKIAVRNAHFIKTYDEYVNASPEKQQAYNQAIQDAKAVLYNQLSTVDDINNALTKINEALADLDGTHVNLTKLEELVKNGENIKQNGVYVNGTEGRKNRYDQALSVAEEILNDYRNGGKQDVVDAMVVALENAQLNLDGLQTNKVALEQQVNRENDVKAGYKYYNADKNLQTEYDAAIQAGQELINNNAASQTEVDAAVSRIQAAENALNGLETDKTALKQAITKADNVKNTTQYTNSSEKTRQALDTALAEGKRIDALPTATQAQVDDARDAIINALANLSGKETDKDKLKEAIDNANIVIPTDKYTNATVDEKNAVNKALQEAEKLMKNDAANQDAVNAATDALNNAVAELSGKTTDKTALQAAINQFETTSQEAKYYNASKDKQNAYKEAVEAGKLINAKEKATQEEVNAATTAITNAESALNGTDTNMSALEALINDQANIHANYHYYNATQNLQKTYDDLINQAKLLKEKPKATQDEVDAMVGNINEALSNLQGAETDFAALKQAIADQATVQGSEAYSNADKDLQDVYNAAISAGKETEQKPNVTQAEVNQAVANINAAKAALNGQATDTSKLEEAVKEQDTVHKENAYYNATPDEQKAYDKAIADGQAVLDNPKANQTAVNNALDAINNAIAQLSGQKTNTDKLKAAIDNANAAKATEKYYNATVDEKNAVDNALKDAQELMGNSSATQTAVDQATKALNDAVAALTGKATNKDALQTAINDFETTSQEAKYYNADKDKQNAYKQAIEAGKLVNAKENASQDEVNAATEAINNAKDALNGVNTDKSALQAAINDFETTSQDAKYYNADKDKQNAYKQAIEAGKLVNAKENASQDEVNAATEAINNAKDALNGATTDKSALQASINDFETTSQDAKYYNATTDKQNAYKQAIEAGKLVNAKENASQDEVNAATEAINTAAAALDGVATDMTALKQAIAEQATVQESEAYTNADKNLQDAYNATITAGQELEQKANVTQAEVNQVVANINTAKDALNGQATDKAKLEDAVKAQASVHKTAEYYNASSVEQKAYDDAIKAGQAVLDNPKATQNDVDNALKAIEDAQKALTGTKTDKTNLEKAINEAKTSQNTAKYINASDDAIKALENALANANEVISNPNATQEQVNQATEDLQNAVKNLDGKDTDKSGLSQVIDKAENLKHDGAYINADADKQKALDDALANAKEVMANPTASQEDVNKVIENLNKAIDDLNGKPTNKDSLKDAIANATNAKNTDDYKNADADKQKTLEDALANAKEVMDNPEASQADVNKAVEDINNAIKGIEDDALNKYKEQAKDIIDGLDHLTYAEKQHYKDLIDNAQSKEEIDKILADANKQNLENAKNDAIKAIEDMKNLTDEEKQDFIDRIKNAHSVAEIEDILKEAMKKNAAMKSSSSESDTSVNKDGQHNKLPETNNDNNANLLLGLGSALALMAIYKKKREENK